MGGGERWEEGERIKYTDITNKVHMTYGSSVDKDDYEDYQEHNQHCSNYPHLVVLPYNVLECLPR